MQKDIKKVKSLANYGIAYTLSNGVQKGIGFCVFMYFASSLSTKEYANFGLSYSLFTVISGLASAGIIEAVISLIKEKRSEGELTNVIKSANVVFILLSIATSTVVTFFVLVFYGEYLHSNYFFSVLLIGALLSSYFTYQSVLVRLDEKHFASIILSSFPSVLGYLVGFFLTTLFKRGNSFFIGFLIAQLISIILLFFFNKDDVKGFLFNRAYIAMVSSRIFPYLIIAALAWALGYGNTFLIKILFDDFQVALFVLLFTISSIIQLVATSMNQVWSPRFFNNYGTSSIEIEEINYKKFTLIQGIVLGVVGAIILVMFPIASMIFPSFAKFNNPSLEMMLLFLGYIFSIPWWHCQNYYMINNKGKSLMYLTVFAGVLGYGLWVFLMLWLGHIGIYLGFVIQMLLKSILVYAKSRSYWKLNFDWQGMVLGGGILIMAYYIMLLIK